MVSDGVPTFNANTINLANGSSMGVSINTSSSPTGRMAGIGIVNQSPSYLSCSVIDSPPTIGPYYYSIFATGSITSDILAENVMITILKVA